MPNAPMRLRTTRYNCAHNPWEPIIVRLNPPTGAQPARRALLTETSN
jgi:hypothetical protein